MSALLKSNRGSQYSDDIRRQAMADYVVLGNQTKVANNLNVTKSVISDWVNSAWGQSLINEIRTEKSDELIAGYTTIIDAAIARTRDGLDRGDYIGTDSDGNDVYRPVKARDAIVIAGIATDKMRLLSNQATTITANDSTLTKISEQLAAYAKDQAIKTIDASHTVSHTDDVSD